MHLYCKLADLDVIRRYAGTAIVLSALLNPMVSAVCAQSPAAVRTATTDTGALAPGHRDFSRYTTPGMCLAAVQRELSTTQRTLAVQAAAIVARRTPERDTLPTNAIMIARMCAARFPIGAAAVHELPALFMLVLAAGQDSMADTMVARQLAAVASDSQRAQLLLTAQAMYLTATPARVAAARALIDRVGKSASGTSATGITQRLQLQLYKTLLQFWALQRPDATERQQLADSMLHVLHGKTATELTTWQRQWFLSDAYQALMNVAYLTHRQRPDSVLLQLAQQAKDDLLRVPPETLWFDPKPSGTPSSGTGPTRVLPAGRTDEAMRAAGYQKQILGRDWRPVPLSAIVQEFFPEGVAVLADTTRSSKPLVAQVWRPAGAPTAQLAPDGVALRYRLHEGCISDYEAPLENEVCSVPLVQLQQWMRQYGSKIQLTVFTVAHGHALYAGPQSPEAEADTIAWYIRDYWHLPARVAVLPAPPSEKERTWNAGPDLEIADGTGRIIYQGPIWMPASSPLQPTQDPVPFITALLARTLTSSPAPP